MTPEAAFWLGFVLGVVVSGAIVAVTLAAERASRHDWRV